MQKDFPVDMLTGLTDKDEKSVDNDLMNRWPIDNLLSTEIFDSLLHCAVVSTALALDPRVFYSVSETFAVTVG